MLKIFLHGCFWRLPALSSSMKLADVIELASLPRVPLCQFFMIYMTNLALLLHIIPRCYRGGAQCPLFSLSVLLFVCRVAFFPLHPVRGKDVTVGSSAPDIDVES